MTDDEWFMSDEERAKIEELRRLKEYVEQSAERSSSTRDHFKRIYRLLVGSDLETMLSSREECQVFLNSPSWKHRLTAIAILHCVFGADQDFADVFERMAFEDPEPQVRGTALYILASYLERSSDPRIARVLAQIESTSSWRQRLDAMVCLRRAWATSRHLADMCERLAFHDPHPQVRDTAIYTVGCCYQASKDPRIGKLLAEAVLNEALPESFRTSAYSGLLLVHGQLLESQRVQHRFPKGVDWDFVKAVEAGEDEDFGRDPRSERDEPGNTKSE